MVIHFVVCVVYTMIYTITTNPSLDYTVEADLIPGRVNRTRSEIIYPGGKGINVSLVLQRLGMETKALGFAAGRIGQAIRDLRTTWAVPMSCWSSAAAVKAGST